MAYNFRKRNSMSTRGTDYESSSDNDNKDSDPDWRDMGRKKARPSRTPVQTTKRTVLSWLINLGIVVFNEPVWYVDALTGNILVKGLVNEEGIVCHCCSHQVSMREFGRHAGMKTRKLYKCIVLERSKLLLLECQMEAWKVKKENERHKFNYIQPAPNAVDKKDDTCMICADGGDLVCCHLCPSTFHAKCIFMETIPQGDWLCSYCVCKYCGRGDKTLNRCMQCEKKYHSKCGGEKLDLMNSSAALFCGNSCRKIHEGLKSLVGVRNDLGEGLSWTLLQRTDQPLIGSNSYDEYNRIQCNSKIAVAWLLMNKCFLSAIDRYTKTNIAQSIVYNRGSNITRINYSGFYTAVLERNDEIISVASIRVHGKRLAEVPYIGTREEHGWQGMTQVLEKCVESVLCSLEVEKLVILSRKKCIKMWIDEYSFKMMDEDGLQDLSVYNTVMFPNSIVKLQKLLAPLLD